MTPQILLRIALVSGALFLSIQVLAIVLRQSESRLLTLLSRASLLALVIAGTILIVEHREFVGSTLTELLDRIRQMGAGYRRIGTGDGS